MTPNGASKEREFRSLITFAIFPKAAFTKSGMQRFGLPVEKKKSDRERCVKQAKCTCNSCPEKLRELIEHCFGTRIAEFYLSLVISSDGESTTEVSGAADSN